MPLSITLDAGRHTPVLKLLPWSGDGTTRRDSGLANVTARSSKWFTAVARQADAFRTGVTVAAGGSADPAIHVVADAVRLDFDPTIGKPVAAADTMLVPNGNLMQFDGTNYSELNFPLYPEVPTLVASSGAGALTNSGVYRYRLVHRYIDAQGRIHRSRPSPPATTALTLGGTGNTVTMTIYPLWITGRKVLATGGVNSWIEVYRTLNGGTTYYLSGTVANDPGAAMATRLTYIDLISDTNLASAEILYTQGTTGPDDGPLPSDSPPQSRGVCVVRDRVWSIDADFPTRAWYSKAITPGYGPQFSAEQVVDIDDEEGDLTGVWELDGKVLFFKRSAIYALGGDGPDDLGRGSFAPPVKVVNGVGLIATAPRSLVTFTDGVAFQSAKGIYALNRGLTAENLGAQMGGPADTIVDAVHEDAKNVVKFYGGAIYKWDYFFKEWSYDILTAPPGVACKAGTSIYRATDAAGVPVVTVESSAVFRDVSTDYLMRLGTGWLLPWGVNGRGRVYGLQLLVEYVAAAGLAVDLYYDHSDTIAKTMTFTTGSGISRIDIREPRQCSAIKVVIRDTVITTSTEAFRFNGMSLIVGDKPGLAKLGSAARMT